MSLRSAYSLVEARQMLTLWKDCERALASGQAKSYRVGTREFTSVDLEDISRRIQYFSDVVETLSGESRNTRVVRVVPRDL